MGGTFVNKKFKIVVILLIILSVVQIESASAEVPGRWRKIASSLEPLWVQTLVIDPQNSSNIFVGTALGAFKSIDRGNTWDTMNLMPAGEVIFSTECIAIDPLNASVIYVGVSQKGIFKTNDGGGTWNAINTGLPDLNIRSIAIDPQNTSVIYAGTSRGIFKSENGGNSWSDKNISPVIARVQALAVDPKDTFTIYAGIWGRGIYKSTDGGSTWRLKIAGLSDRFISELAVNPKEPLVLYTALRGGVFKTSDGGTTWNSINTGLTDLNIAFLTIDEQNSASLYAGNPEGLFRWITAGSQTILVFQIDEREFKIDGIIQFMDAEPKVLESRTMLPIRFVAEPLGAKISWEATARKATVSLDDTILELWINNPTARINGREVNIDPANPQVMPILSEGRTLLPLRFVSESLGADVSFDSKLRTVTISHTARR